MSKRQFKSSANSGRAVAGFGGFGSSISSQSSILSYIQEPLDLQSISDAQIVVIFKNLAKRDDTTKARALDDLQASFNVHNDLEDGVLEAWVRLFPRLSIDNSRRVRQLAHNVNGKICSIAGKRTAKHMQTIAGPWLAGMHDIDRTVARAAQVSLSLVFPDTAKVAALRKVYHQAILDYCKDAVLHETISTLSDERVVSQDDAENTYSRVVSSSLALITSFVNDEEITELSKYQETYTELLDTRMIEFGIHTDVGVRRSAHRLLRQAALRLGDVLQQRLQQISEIYVDKGLRSDQTASSPDYVTTLVILTEHYPTIWTDAYIGRKTPGSRLSYFLKQGSRSPSVDFWAQLSQLLTGLPRATLATTMEEVQELLAALREGLSQRESRFQATEAWQTYQDLASKLIEHLDVDAQKAILSQNALPAIKEYVFPADKSSEWTISDNRAASIVARLSHIPHFAHILAAELPDMGTKLLETMKLLQPEQAKDYKESQTQVIKLGERWSGLQRELFAMQEHNPLLEAAFISEDTRIIAGALQLCATRNGKVYGAAAVVSLLLRDCSSELIKRSDIRQLLQQFVNQHLSTLLLTPSSTYLIACLGALQDQDEYETLFHKISEFVLDLPAPIKQKAQLIVMLYSLKLSREMSKNAVESAKLQAFVLEVCQSQAETDELTGIDLSKLRSLGVMAHHTQLESIRQWVKSLHDDQTTFRALGLLNTLASTHHNLLVIYDTDPIAADNHLISNVLRLTESEDDKIAQLAADLQDQLSLTHGPTSGNAQLTSIRRALEDVSPSSSSSIEAVSELAEKLLGPNSQAEGFLACLPDVLSWKHDLQNHLNAPPSSMSISSPLGSAVYLVDQSARERGGSSHDVDGLTIVLRRAFFLTSLLHTTNLADVIKTSTDPAARSLYEMLVLAIATMIAAQDKVSMSSANKLWLDDPPTEATLLIQLDHGNQNIAVFIGQLQSDQFHDLVDATIMPEDEKTSPLAYYLALTRVLITLNHSSQAVSLKEQDLSKTITSELQNDTLSIMARIDIASQSPFEQKQITKLTNELIAMLTGTDFTTATKDAELHLMALNTILKSEETHISRVAKQRVIFLVKHLLKELEKTESRIVGEEILRALGHLLPAICDIYGEHWMETLDNIIKTWSSIAADYQGPDHVPTLYHTLRLYEVLKKLTGQDEVSEDLTEAFQEKGSEIAGSLVSLLKTTTADPDASDQPLMMTNGLLARQIATLKVKPAVDNVGLLPVLYAPSPSVQQAAFTLLHEHIPKSQEQVSMDAALDNKVARLPDELLSMLLEAPLAESFQKDDFDRFIPATLQSYLYSWRVLFDYLSSSSYKVKTDYSDQLKDGLYLSRLLDFAFDFLGHVRGKPVDVSGHDIVSYQSNLEPDAQKDVRWLLSHLYYQALLHLPSLVKSYVLGLRSRQMPTLIEEWTAKHISPALITANLQAVSEWSEKTVREDPEYEKMAVKVASRSKEVNVSYIVDEQTMAIKIVLPDAYPLAPALVLGVSRVAVREEKWQSWLRNCQGVITFSNGSITDGLAAWRRNVTGALKGQTECAICYSIISADKQLPTKRCPTCKNLFHSSCLFKWFKTSNASTCPLCRNPFNFN